MKILHVLSIVSVMALFSTTASAATVTLPLNQQVIGTPTTQSPTGEAIYNYVNAANNPVSFQSDGTGAYVQENIGNPKDWWYLMVDTKVAGVGPFDLSAPGSTISFDARYFQDPQTNTSPYSDAPIFLRAYSMGADGNTLLGYRDYSIVWATQAPLSNPQFPTWSTAMVDVNTVPPGGSTNSAFDPANIGRIRFYGTDWKGAGNDYVNFRNLTVSGANVRGGAAIPEPATMTLLGLGLLPLLRRRKS